MRGFHLFAAVGLGLLLACPAEDASPAEDAGTGAVSSSDTTGGGTVDGPGDDGSDSGPGNTDGGTDGGTDDGTDDGTDTGNESDNDVQNLRGTLSMARLPEPDTATSQFLVNLVDNPGLDASDGYAVFAEVVEGMEVVDAIAAVMTADMLPYEDGVDPPRVATIVATSPSTARRRPDSLSRWLRG